jgi:hypothetical protein
MPLTVSQTFLLEKKHDGVSAAVRACDITLFLVAYVSGFMAKRLLSDSSCDTCKQCLISEVPSPLDTYAGFMERNSRYSRYSATVLKNVVSNVARSQLNCVSQML